MARCLLTRADVSAVHLIGAQWQYDSLHGAVPHTDARLHLHLISIGKNVLSRNLWYYTQLSVLAEHLEADIVHLAYPVPLKRHAFQCPVVVTLHDLYPYDIPANFGFPKILFNRMILRLCLREVDTIACVSKSTLRRLEICFPQLARQKAIIIHNCVEAGPKMSIKSPLQAWDGLPFLLCVAQHRRNKNIVLAIQIFQHLLLNGEISPTTLLVIIGIEGPETARIHRFIRDADLTRHIVLLCGVDDAELQWCYGHCKLLLATSIVEGFGLPIVEAMLHRCRIVCSDIPAFREVGGSYCHYASLNPPAVNAFVQAISSALKNIKLRTATTDRFSGARIAEAYMRLYTRLRSGRSVLEPQLLRSSSVIREKGRP